MRWALKRSGVVKGIRGEVINQIIEKNENPFESERFISVGSKREREQILSEREPYIVIATSGMLNGGPILEYLKKFGEDEKSCLIFVGYQAQGTLGNKIQKGEREVEIGNERIRERFVYSYRLVYRIEEKRILIVAVIHGKRLFESIAERFEAGT